MSWTWKRSKTWPPTLTGKSNPSRLFVKYNLFSNIHGMGVRIMNKPCFSATMLFALLQTQKHAWDRKWMVKNRTWISYFGELAKPVNIRLIVCQGKLHWALQYVKLLWGCLSLIPLWGTLVSVQGFSCPRAPIHVQSNLKSHWSPDSLSIYSQIHMKWDLLVT